MGMPTCCESSPTSFSNAFSVERFCLFAVLPVVLTVVVVVVILPDGWEVTVVSR